jgi:hypothetical protein
MAKRLSNGLLILCCVALATIIVLALINPASIPPLIFCFMFLLPVACGIFPLLFQNILVRLVCVGILVLTLGLTVVVDHGTLPTIARRHAIDAGRATGQCSKDYQAGIDEAIRQVRAGQRVNPLSFLLVSSIAFLALLPKRKNGCAINPKH